jgi:hypothetical protein
LASSIATFYLIPNDELHGLRDAASGARHDTYWKYVETRAKRIIDYPWSGYVYGALIPYLEDHYDIDLFNNELSRVLSEARQSVDIVLAEAQKDKYLEPLRRIDFSASDMARYFNELYEASDFDATEAMVDAVDALRRALERVSDTMAVLLTIG